ncbi:MAG: 8-oxo-dGTP diphosphatase [Solobacterium sp.]|nr:8-oxo-dGTP diphosphatase [Solobacterium sp.]
MSKSICDEGKDYTLIYLRHERLWLMMLRNKKKKDINAGKWIGVGGKAEAGESIRDGALREIREETGIVPDSLDFRGIVNFFYEGEESECMWLYTAETSRMDTPECSEGTLAWIREEDIMALELWEGDRIFLKKLLERDEELIGLDLSYDSCGNLTGSSEFVVDLRKYDDSVQKI